MRNVKKIILHCSASDKKEDDSFDKIKLLHAGRFGQKIKWGEYDTICRGWLDIGYHYLITKDGTIYFGRDIHKPGAHCKGHNRDSIGICLTGNKEFSNSQFMALKLLLDDLKFEFGLSDELIFPHNHFNKNKTCPNFDIKEN